MSAHVRFLDNRDGRPSSWSRSVSCLEAGHHRWQSAFGIGSPLKRPPKKATCRRGRRCWMDGRGHLVTRFWGMRTIVRLVRSALVRRHSDLGACVSERPTRRWRYPLEARGKIASTPLSQSSDTIRRTTHFTPRSSQHPSYATNVLHSKPLSPVTAFLVCPKSDAVDAVSARQQKRLTSARKASSSKGLGKNE
jgi:hypothetical protein